MKATRVLVVCAFFFLPGILIAADRFDGNWHTKIVCPPKGSTEGFTWYLDGVVENSNFHALRGTQGEPGSFLLTGKIEADGSAKLTGDGFINSRKYARGVFAHKGEEYTWDVKATFKDHDGTGLRNEGLGIVGRPCTFEFTRQEGAPASPASPTSPGL
jgi:hypothetical protein